MVVLGRALCIALAVHVPHDLLAGRPRVAALAAPVRPDGLRRAARPGHGAAASSQALGAASTCADREREPLQVVPGSRLAVQVRANCNLVGNWMLQVLS